MTNNEFQNKNVEVTKLKTENLPEPYRSILENFLVNDESIEIVANTANCEVQAIPGMIAEGLRRLDRQSDCGPIYRVLLQQLTGSSITVHLEEVDDYLAAVRFMCRLGRAADGVHICECAIRLAEKNQSSNDIVNSRVCIGTVYRRLANRQPNPACHTDREAWLRRARVAFETALSSAREFGMIERVATIQQQSAQTLYDLQLFDESLLQALAVQDYYREIRDDVRLERINRLIDRNWRQIENG